MDEKRKKEILEVLSSPPFNLLEVTEKSLSIFDQALTHSPYAKDMRDRKIECNDYERLEFLGNYVLDFVVSEYIFKKFRDDSEGDMSDRKKITSNKLLADTIRKKDIGVEKCIRLGKGQALNDCIVADAFEALIGAIYLEHCDQDIARLREVVLGLLGNEIDDFVPINYIGRLQEFVQINKLGDLQYKEKKTGPDDSPMFRSIVEISGKKCGEGEGRQKKDAKREAARFALVNLGAAGVEINELRKKAEELEMRDTR
jgi:ribonuclease-3